MLIAACSEGDVVVSTHQEAFNLMKREILAKHMGKLKSVGADASIFEDVNMNVLGDQPCNKPKRYSNASGTSKKATASDDIFVKLFETRKGNCKKCWDQIKIEATITRTGKIYGIEVRREPSWKKIINADGMIKQPGDKGEQCGPIKM